MVKGGDVVIFQKSHRMDAFKLALDINKNKKGQWLEALKAFCFLTVRIRIDDQSESYLSQCGEKINVAKEKRIVDRVVTPAGFDVERKRGEAQQYTRQAVIRTWPYKGTSHPGHAALSVKNDIDCDDEHTYISWWPSPEDRTGFIGRALNDTAFGDIFVKQKGHSNTRYLFDKYDALSDSAREKLQNSTKAREAIEKGDKSAQNYAMAAIEPRERQKVLSEPIETEMNVKNAAGEKTKEVVVDESPWGVSSDKVYVPLMGENSDKDTDRKIFTMFGLHEAKMNFFWKKISNDQEANEAYYKMYSRHKNCAGMVLTGLEEGGAEFFVDEVWTAKASINPNYVHSLAVVLQERVDELNNMSIPLLKNYRKALRKLPSAEREKYQAFRDVLGMLNEKVAQMPAGKKKEKAKKIAGRFGDVLKLTRKDKLATNHLMPLAIKVTEDLNKFFDGSEDESLRFLMLSSFDKVSGMMKDIHAVEDEKYKKMMELLD